MTSGSVPSILVVEDDFVDQLAFKSLVNSGRLPCTYTIAGTVAEGRRLLALQKFDVVFLDHRLPDGNAFDLLEGPPVAPVVIYATGAGDEETAVRALRAGLSDYLIKDPERNYLRALPGKIERALRQWQMQKDLEKSEARLRDLFEKSSDLIHSTAPDGQLQFVNRAWRSTLGYSEDEISKLNLYQTLHPDHQAPYRQMMERLLAGEDQGSLAFTVCTRDGRAVELEGHVSVRFENGTAISTQGIFRDVTESKQNAIRLREFTENLEKLVAERTGALVESQARFVQMANTIEEVFWMKDLKTGSYIYASPAFEELWERPLVALYGDSLVWKDAIHPEDCERVAAAFQDGNLKKYDVEYRIVRPNSSIRWIHEHGYWISDEQGVPYRLLGTATDITRSKEMSEQILRTQRLESIGTLSGGIAHDLNNSLAPILMGLTLLRDLYPEEAALIDTMEASGLRGVSMVKQLLTYAKGESGEKVMLQPQKIFKELEQFIRLTFPKNISLEFSCPKTPDNILGDATQLYQVLLNLCLNARDAMAGGGTLSLSMQNLTMDAKMASHIPGAAPGRYVQWSVADTGSGIAPALLDRIFDPFFTTKSPGKGTGLGLSTVLGIVRSHVGVVQVLSDLGRGSAFHVYLPVAESDPESERTGPKSTSMQFAGNGETILVVDDELHVRTMTSAVLKAMNFRVLTASDGTEGLALVASQGADLNLVITDIHMPQMDGLGFVTRLRRIAPALPVIVCSGRIEPEMMAEFALQGVTASLPKPFTREALALILEQSLTSGHPS